MAISLHKPLLTATTSIALVTFAINAYAADVTVTERTTPVIATADGDQLSVTGSGSVSVSTDTAFQSGTFNDLDITINTTDGVTASGGNIAIEANNVLASIDTITVTDGFVTSDSTTATIMLSGESDTTTITTTTDGSIANTGTAGDAIYVVDDDDGQSYTINVNNAGSITTTNNASSVAVNLVDDDSDSALNVTSTGTINAGSLGTAISVSHSNTADVEITAGSVTGAVVLGSNAASELDLTGGTLTGDVTLDNASQTFTYSGGTFSGTVDGAGQFHVDSSLTNQALGGTTGLTEVEVSNDATLTVGANITATNVNVDNGEIDFGSTNRTITGNLSSGATDDSTIDIQNGAHSVSGTYSMSAGDTLGVNVTGKDVDDIGSITSGGAATIASGALLDIDYTSTEYIADGETFVLVDGTGGTGVNAITAGNIDINGTGSNTIGLITYTTTGGEDLTLVASRDALNVVGDDQHTSSLGAALETIGTAGTDNDTEVEDFIDAVLDSSNVTAANAIMDSATPATDNSLTQGMFEATGEALEVVNTRLSGIRSSAAGISSGDHSAGFGAWLQGFGGVAEQEDTDGVFGYDAETYGAAIGIDRTVADNVVLGVSGSASQTEIENNSGLKETDVKSYQVNIYGSYDFDNYFVDGVAGVSYNDYESKRTILAPSSTARGDFKGRTYMASLTTGYQAVLDHGFEVTPTVGVTYARNNVDAYTETGAGSMNLVVSEQEADRFEGKLGLSVANTYTVDIVKVRPQIRAAVAHDFIGDEQSATVNFQDIATTFDTEGADIEKTSYEAGVGLDIMTENGLTFSANYDYEGRSNFDSHIGALKVRYDF